MALESRPPLSAVASGTSLRSRKPAGIKEQGAEFLGLLVQVGARLGQMVERVPPGIDPDASVGFDHHRMTGRQATDPGEQGVGRGFLPVDVGERLGENFRIEGAVDPGQGEKRLEFGGEDEGAGVIAVMQRLDAEAVARQEQPTLSGIPDGEGPHAIEAQLALLSPLRIGGEDDLAVGVGDETVAEATQLLAQLEIVVDLAVIGQPVAPLGIGHRLAGPFGEVEDGEPTMAEPKPRFGEMLDAEAVRPTMGKTVGERGKHRLREILRGITPNNPSRHTSKILNLWGPV